MSAIHPYRTLSGGCAVPKNLTFGTSATTIRLVYIGRPVRLVDTPMKTYSIALLAIMAMAGCKGPGQTAGEAQDKAAAVANGQQYSGEGPNERIGKAVDRAAEAAKDARDASAVALKKQADAIRREADVGADRLKEQAKAVTSEADRRADVLDKQAKATN